jgi:hypothetical protein
MLLFLGGIAPNEDKTENMFFVWLPEIEVVAERIYNLNIEVKPIDNIDSMIAHYDDYFGYVSQESRNEYGNLPKSFIFSYFGWETDFGNSYLWLKGFNAGGVKGRGKNGFYVVHDDDPNDEFARYKTLKESADRWVQVFNNRRFKKCRCNGDSPEELEKLFKCFQNNVYHTDNSWYERYKIAIDYELRRNERKSI